MPKIPRGFQFYPSIPSRKDFPESLRSNNIIYTFIPDPIDPHVNLLNPPNKAMRLLYRRDWDAIPPVYRIKCQRSLELVILRYTGTEPCFDEDSCCKTLADLQKVQIEKYNQADITWSFMVGGDAQVYEGTGWRHTTPKEGDLGMHDFINIDIAYIARDINDVTKDMRWACRKLIEHSCRHEILTDEPKFIGEKEAIDTLYTL